MGAWLTNLLAALEQSGLARSDGEAFVLADDPDLPDPNEILQSFAADYPRRSAELLLASRTGARHGSLDARRDRDRLDERIRDRILRRSDR